MNPRYPAVAERALYRCEYCRAPQEVFNFPFEVEHRTPRARGGANDDGNLSLSCPACNRFKGDAQTGFDEETQENVALFHPRKDAWEEHFRIEAETAQIVGLTPKGRATVARLQMNRPAQIRARFRWMELGLFP